MSKFNLRSSNFQPSADKGLFKFPSCAINRVLSRSGEFLAPQKVSYTTFAFAIKPLRFDILAFVTFPSIFKLQDVSASEIRSEPK